MRRFATLAVVVMLVPALAGCLTSETLVKVNADGSGTIEQVMLMNVKTLDMMPAMMGDALGADVQQSKSSSEVTIDPTDLFNEEQAREAAAKLGSGVRFVSSEPLARGDFQGARMLYEFDDVNALTIEQDQAGDALSGGATKTDGDALELQLTRQPNGNALLTINLEEQTAAKSKDSASKASAGDVPPEMEEMLMQMFDGFRVAIDIEVDGTIVNTSSPFASGSRVTVLEMDLGMLMKDQTNMKRLGAIEPGASVAEMIPLLKDVKGIKVNESPLTIEFTGR